MVVLLTLIFCYPIDSWQSELLEEVLVRRGYFVNTPGIRPFAENEVVVTDGSEPVDTILSPVTDHLWLSNILLTSKFDTVRVTRLKPTVHYNFFGFNLHLQPEVKFGTDSLPPNRVFKNLFSADYERVFARYQNQHFHVFIGRERFSIGPSPRFNLLLSGYSVPLY